MRLLFLSNFYPPYSRGGYEEWCREVAEGLSSRGHTVAVLTSDHGGAHAPETGAPAVLRTLHLEMELTPRRNAMLFFTTRARRERANLEEVHRQMAAWTPEAVVVWGMWNMPRTIPALVEEVYADRTVYYFGDYWPTLPGQWWHYWYGIPQRRPSRWLKAALRSLALRRLAGESPPALRFPHALFPSEYMRRAFAQHGVTTGQESVIYGGVDLTPYRRAAAESRTSAQSPHAPADLHPTAGSLRLLTAGRLVPDKGIHTAIQALGILVKRQHGSQVLLTIAGAGDPAYVNELRRLAESVGVAGQVRFTGAVPKEQMPNLYAGHDIFVFPSIWPEPFGRVLVEAMAAGLAVVAAPVGGAGEIVCDDRTGLTFPPGDAAALAAQIARLAADAGLRARLSRLGQAEAVRRFDIVTMTDGIESYLLRVVQAA